MIALCVDDEAALLAELVRAVEASPDVTEAVRFQKCSEVLEWAQDHRPDVAFLDIRMRGMTGLELAEQLQERYPELPVVFCTGYSEYAVDAFRLHVAGYLMKPVRPEDVQRELDIICEKTGIGAPQVSIQCFGNFEVFVDGKVLHFKRKRAKELLAYLVDRRGSLVSSKEICTVMWEDDDQIERNMMHLYKLFGDLRKALAEVGAEDLLIRGKQDYAIDTAKVDCDYYRFLAGDPIAAKKFYGEYMTQYSWAEETAALLTRDTY